MIPTDDSNDILIRLKVGDQVSVIDDITKGRIVKIRGNKIIMLNDLGFEEEYPALKLVRINQTIVEDMERSQVSQEVIHSKENVTPEQKSRSNLKKDKPIEIDLHIEKLIDSPHRFFNIDFNHEMLQIQLYTAREAIERAIREKHRRLIFIHGHGHGVLKRELYHLLEDYSNLRYLDTLRSVSITLRLRKFIFILPQTRIFNSFFSFCI